MKKEAIKRRLIQDPIFKFDFNLQIGGSLESFVQHFKQQTGYELKDDSRFQLMGLFIWNPKYYGMCGIWLSSFTHKLVSHEVTHAVNHVIEHTRVPTEGNNEFASCYHEWITDELFKLQGKK